MRAELLREIAEEYLVPFFSGAYIADDAEVSSARQDVVSMRGPLSIAFKVKRDDKYRLVLTRAQPFAQTSSDATIPEINVVRAFVEILGRMDELLEGPLKRDLLQTFQRRVVARAVGGSENEEVILNGIDRLVTWSASLYEGGAVSAALGFRSRPQEDELTLDKFGENDFGAVLSNGYDTILEFDFSGNFVSHVTSSARAAVPSYCPYRHGHIALWTSRDDRRIAMTLNRLGEISIFQSQELLFTRRGGRWSFLTHDPLIMQMRIPRDVKLRTAIYETCLDSSFGRSGACFGIVGIQHQHKWTSSVAKDDWLVGGQSFKSRAIAKIVAGRKFTALERQIRLELSAIDGATLISHNGDILAVGAIVKVPGGSKGGGRTAAAIELSKLGLGIKVSQDGGISGFRGGKAGSAFRVM